MSDEIAIKVDGVYKNFKLPHEKVNSLKAIFTGLTKKKARSFEIQHALKDISFEVKKGEFFGIVGRNGSGKSTLLKIIAEIYQPTKGSLEKHGKLVPFIELGVGFNPELTGRENVYLNGALLGFSEKEVDELYDDIVDFAELKPFMDQKLKNYSSGMQVRLAFSVATRAKADILLIDEVLAVGDADFQRKCFNFFKELKAHKTTVIFVSHDMSAVREFCDRAMLIEKNQVVATGDTFEIAQKYSELFLEDQKEQRGAEISTQWGDGRAKVENVSLRLIDGNLEVNHEVDIKNDIGRIIYGIHIIAADGVEVTAMNNVMIGKPAIQEPLKGDRRHIKWIMQNIFSDGKYSIDLTLVDGVGDVLDWHKSAARFTVKRQERSTTPVTPPVDVTIS